MDSRDPNFPQQRYYASRGASTPQRTATQSTSRTSASAGSRTSSLTSRVKSWFRSSPPPATSPPSSSHRSQPSSQQSRTHYHGSGFDGRDTENRSFVPPQSNTPPRRARVPADTRQPRFMEHLAHSPEPQRQQQPRTEPDRSSYRRREQQQQHQSQPDTQHRQAVEIHRKPLPRPEDSLAPAPLRIRKQRQSGQSGSDSRHQPEPQLRRTETRFVGTVTPPPALHIRRGGERADTQRHPPPPPTQLRRSNHVRRPRADSTSRPTQPPPLSDRPLSFAPFSDDSARAPSPSLQPPHRTVYPRTSTPSIPTLRLSQYGYLARVVESGSRTPSPLPATTPSPPPLPERSPLRPPSVQYWECVQHLERGQHPREQRRVEFVPPSFGSPAASSTASVADTLHYYP